MPQKPPANVDARRATARRVRPVSRATGAMAWALAAGLLASSGAHARPADEPSPTAAPAPPQPPAEAAGATPDAPISSDQRYRRGKNLFEYGDCAGTLEMLAPLAVPGTLDDGKSQVDVYRMLGVCHALSGDGEAASRAFAALLAIEPDYQLDPFLAPPAAVELFEQQKTLMRAKLDEIRRARERDGTAASGAAGGVLLERTVTVRDVPLWSAFVPFGLAQLENGEPVAALAFGAAQGGLLAINVAAFWVNIAAKQNGIENDAELLVHHVAWPVHVGALALLGATYVAGVGEALWNREDQAVVRKRQTKRPLTQDEIDRLRRVPLASAPAVDDSRAPAPASEEPSDGTASPPPPPEAVPEAAPERG